MLELTVYPRRPHGAEPVLWRVRPHAPLDSGVQLRQLSLLLGPHRSSASASTTTASAGTPAHRHSHPDATPRLYAGRRGGNPLDLLMTPTELGLADSGIAWADRGRGGSGSRSATPPLSSPPSPAHRHPRARHHSGSSLAGTEATPATSTSSATGALFPFCRSCASYGKVRRCCCCGSLLLLQGGKPSEGGGGIRRGYAGPASPTGEGHRESELSVARRREASRIRGRAAPMCTRCESRSWGGGGGAPPRCCCDCAAPLRGGGGLPGPPPLTEELLSELAETGPLWSAATPAGRSSSGGGGGLPSPSSPPRGGEAKGSGRGASSPSTEWGSRAGSPRRPCAVCPGGVPGGGWSSGGSAAASPEHCGQCGSGVAFCSQGCFRLHHRHPRRRQHLGYQVASPRRRVESPDALPSSLWVRLRPGDPPRCGFCREGGAVVAESGRVGLCMACLEEGVFRAEMGRLRLVLRPCEFCDEAERRPALMHCGGCKLSLCPHCWAVVHAVGGAGSAHLASNPYTRDVCRLIHAIPSFRPFVRYVCGGGGSSAAPGPAFPPHQEEVEEFFSFLALGVLGFVPNCLKEDAWTRACPSFPQEFFVEGPHGVTTPGRNSPSALSGSGFKQLLARATDLTRGPAPRAPTRDRP